jgi:SAM-dependent methyltransferase
LNYTTILFNRYTYAKYSGKGFTCNYCHHQYEKFIPRYPSSIDEVALEKHQVIAGNGPNVYCPFCGSTSRERLILLKLEEKVNVGNIKILHLSPEDKVFKKLQRVADVTTADVEPGFYKLLDKNIIEADARALPFPDESFDLVIANHVIEHIPEDIVAMQEVFRILKKGGRAIVQVPFSETISSTIEEPSIKDPTRQSQLFGQKDHVRIYSLKDYLKRLTNAGFQVEYETIDLNSWKKYALQEGEGFINCIKSE